jgi:hypothetical protein
MEQSKASPALGVFNNEIWAAFIGNTTNSLYICSSSDGLNWSNHTILSSQKSCHSPSLIEFNNQFWIAFTGATTNDVLVYSYNGNKWSGNSSLGQTSIASPSLAVFKQKLWIAFIAENGSNDILICSSSDGKKWSQAAQIPGQQSKAYPSLAVSDGKLWVAFIGNTSNSIYTFSSGDGIKWSKVPLLSPQESFASPSLAELNSTLWMAFTGNTSNKLLVSFLPGATGEWFPPNLVPGQTSQAAPSLVQFNGKLFLGFLSETVGDTLLVCSSPDGFIWSQASRIGNYPTQRTLVVPDTGYGDNVNNCNFVAKLIMNSDGSYTFSGTYNNSGWLPLVTAYAQNYSVAIAIFANGTTFTFEHGGTAQNASSDSWNITTKNPDIAANWPALVTGPAQCKSTNNAPPGGILNAIGDAISQLWDDVKSFGGTVISVCGAIFGGGASGGASGGGAPSDGGGD